MLTGADANGPHKFVQLFFALVLLLILSGCGVSIPADPDGTLDSVRGGTLRVGAVPNGEFVEVSGPAGPRGAVGEEQVSGSEVDLVRDFADELGARIEFYVAGEEELVRRFDDGSVHLVIGGLTDETPWESDAGVTRPYAERILGGQKRKIVMLVPPGENAFTTELERFLDASAAGAAR
ncbi:transporter substrate-binding domain-containing protein [Zhihengliuella halotolerans]|uniref:transporter substrate-binding domain-containing protein n=1 Tax=Zhihengliuella halotolerans TaxID=370736 RepID=UPI000C801ACB|nr:ABC transporter substrate-binding protein [Zhihengliuella halotolerans]